ncbi:ATP-binding protein [Streptomyces tendae]|uniref:ATP-binding protein n=1 Tax=Streptomyces tendae TaxID=1932 RepID=UPI002490D3B5|nr:ATP-binding protein [Streptomyces tendae]
MANSVFDPCPAAPRTASFRLPAVPSAVREGRRRVGATLLSWGIGLNEDSSWSLTVVCGELLARAVRRAAGEAPGPAGRLAVGVDVDGDQLIVDVRDVPGGAPPPARVPPAFPDAAHAADAAHTHAAHAAHAAREQDGWGRALVDALCTAHGTEHTPDGPRRWAVVTLPGGAFPDPSPAVARLRSTRWVVEPAGAALAAAGSRVVRMGKENVPYA